MDPERPSATKLGEEFGESESTVRRWLEPLRGEWEDTVINPRDGRGVHESINLDDVGVSVLKTIRNIPGLDTEDRIDLVEKVAAGEETRSSIRKLKKRIEQSDSSDIDFTEEVEVEQDTESEPTENII